MPFFSNFTAIEFKCCMRKKVFLILEVSQKKNDLSWFFDLFLAGLIVLNIIAYILQTVESIDRLHHDLFRNFEYFSVAFFSLEYLLRMWTIVENPNYAHPVKGRIKYAISAMAIIDLLAVLPFFISLGLMDTSYLRVLRLFRLLRLFKMVRYLSALGAMTAVFRQRKEQLFVSIAFILFMLIISSCLMYFAEHNAQPDVFASIPETMWWGVCTLTTVGYGDLYPITPLGKFLGGMITILGVGLFALPTGILASGFSDNLQRKRALEGSQNCPHCGKSTEVNVEENLLNQP